MTRRRGIRTRLLTAVVVSVGLALVVIVAGFNLLLAGSLSRNADSMARARAEAEAAAIEVAGGRVELPDQPDSGGLESQTWVFRGGDALESPGVSEALDTAAASVAANPGQMIDVPGQHTRLYATPASDAPDVVVVAGVSLVPYERVQRMALLGSCVLAGLLFIVVVLVSRWMLRRALQPVARMTADVDSWSDHDLDRRFMAGEPYDELSQLAATLDGLLDRLSASLRREQRFSAEMSHELRTPLAKVQAEAELALRRPREPAEYRTTLETVMRNARQMNAVVETLVTASRQESGLARGRCGASLVLEHSAESCEGLARVRDLRVMLDLPDERLTLGVDLDVAVGVLKPLLENACRFARSEIRLSARRDGAFVTLGVEDDGPGVHADEVERIFEAGVRGSAAQASVAPSRGEAAIRSPEGAGLGLALARRLAHAAGGEVSASAADGGLFVVRLPAG